MRVGSCCLIDRERRRYVDVDSRQYQCPVSVLVLVRAMLSREVEQFDEKSL